MVDFIHRNNELYHRVLITLIDNLTKKQSILSQFNMTHCVNTLKELKNCQLDSLRTKHNTLFYTLIKSDKAPTFGNTENAIHLTLDYLERSLDIHITQRAQQLGRRIQYSNNRITNEGNRSIVAALALFSTINETRDAIQFHFIEKLFIQYRLFYSATSGQYQPVLAIENNQIIEKHPHDLIQILTLFFRITLAKIDINRGPLFATLFHFVRTVRCLQEGIYLLTLLHRSHHPAIIQFLNNSIESIDNTTMNHCFSGFFKLPSINSRDQLAKPLKNPIYHYLGWEELSTKTPDIFKLLSDRITTPTDQSALQSRQLLNNLRHNTWRKLFRMNQPIEPRTNNDNHQHPINQTQHSHAMTLLPSWIYSKGIGKMKRQNTSTTENNFVPFEITKKM